MGKEAVVCLGSATWNTALRCDKKWSQDLQVKRFKSQHCLSPSDFFAWTLGFRWIASAEMLSRRDFVHLA